MKLVNIKSSDLPEIDESIKECVNLGQWILFKSHSLDRFNAGASFYLKVGSKIFELDDSGKILSTIERETQRVKIDELFYFSDIPQPHSISNMTPLVA